MEQFNPFTLKGKQILVTGASSGIGKAIAISCAKMGATVIATGRNEQRLAETISLMPVGEDINALAEQLPKLDGMVQCAGAGSRVFCKALNQDAIDNIMKPNLEAPVLLQTAILANKKINKGASIVFIASKAADYPSVGNAIYSASKGAIISYSKCLAVELAPRQIRVNCICPAMIWTDLILQDGMTKEEMEEAQLRYPLKRYGQPEDVANLALYLLSDASQWMTGSAIDITGGAPEMNPHFQWFLENACKICDHVIVRTNLVILLEEKYAPLMQVYKDNKVEVVCSLPYYRAKEMDKVRGDGTFEGAIQVLKMLNDLGYGKDPELVLNMVYNPAGAFFPPEQTAMEATYKEKLGKDFGICFNHLFTITNNPIGRFGEFLKRSGNLEGYMKKLHGAFNPGTLPSMMCRFQVSVGYDGALYDCDFNQAGELPVLTGETIFDMVGKPYRKRKICFDKHCYGCTAGQGSSCGGATE